MTPPYTRFAKNSEKIRILGESQNWRCCYCGFRCSWGGAWHQRATREHVQPKSYLRLEDEGWHNEVMACGVCNAGRDRGAYKDYLRLVRRLGRWKAYKQTRKLT